MKAERTFDEHEAVKAVRAIENTHLGLGRPTLGCAIAGWAKRCTYLIAPAGCGKSAILEALQPHFEETIEMVSMTRAGLGAKADQLSGFRGLVWVDDMGAVESAYIRSSMLVSLSELTYRHSISKDSGIFHFTIDSFNAGVVAAIQPTILKGLIRTNEWEANLSDKTLRLYHVIRPVTPNAEPVKLLATPQVDPRRVKYEEKSCPEYSALMDMAVTQWGRTRVKLHLEEMLKVTASLDGSPEVRAIDMRVLAHILRPMMLERHCLHRGGFEEKRSLNTELLHLVTAFATHRELSLDFFTLDYKLSPTTVYEILDRNRSWVRVVSKSPSRWGPSDRMVELLQEIGFGHKVKRSELVSRLDAEGVS